MPRPWHCCRRCRASGRCSRAGRSSNPSGTAPRTRVLATLRSNGYLSAKWSGTAAQVNADANTVRLFLVADSGALFRVGEIRTAGLQRYDEGAVLPVARELIGRPATEQLLRDVQDRILSLGLFESVVIDVDANASDPAVRTGAAGAARTAAAAGHGRHRLCRRHRLAAVAGACAPARLRHALDGPQQAADRPEPELLDRRPDLAPAGRRLPQPARRAGREAAQRRRDALLLVRPRRTHPRHGAHLAPVLRRIHACPAGDLGRHQRQRGAVRQLPLDLARRGRPAHADARHGVVAAGRPGLRTRHGHADRQRRQHRRHRPLRAPVRPGAGLRAAGQLVLRQRPARTGPGVRAGGADRAGHAAVPRRRRRFGARLCLSLARARDRRRHLQRQHLVHRQPAGGAPDLCRPAGLPVGAVRRCGQRLRRLEQHAPGVRLRRRPALAQPRRAAARWTWPTGRRCSKFRLHFSVGVVF